MNAWLIEYEGAVPSPVYVPEVFEHGCYTLDAWAAKRFETKAEAEQWMADPIFGSNHCMPFSAPWHAVEHGFDLRCMMCDVETPRFVAIGEKGLCDGCIPF